MLSEKAKNLRFLKGINIKGYYGKKVKDIDEQLNCAKVNCKLIVKKILTGT